MNDTINRFGTKGYNKAPRILLQTDKISLGAIGLLLNISSYAEGWVLRKSELRNRFKHNGARNIDRLWDELVNAGYIIQFRKRIEKRYEYRYYYDVVPYTIEAIQDLLENNYVDGYLLYHKEMDGDNFKEFIFHEDRELINWDFCELKEEKQDKTKVFSDSQNGKSKLDSSNRDSKKEFRKREYITKKREEEEIPKGDSRDFDNKRVYKALKRDKDMASTMKFLMGCGIGIDVCSDIMLGLLDHRELMQPKLIVGQMKWCLEKDRTDGIGNFAKYFLKGLSMRYKWHGGEVYPCDVEEYYCDALGETKGRIRVTMHNWLAEI